MLRQAMACASQTDVVGRTRGEFTSFGAFLYGAGRAQGIGLLPRVVGYDSLCSHFRL